MKTCPVCELQLPDEAFYPRRRPCRKCYQRAQAARENPVKARARRQRYAGSDKDRARRLRYTIGEVSRAVGYRIDRDDEPN